MERAFLLGKLRLNVMTIPLCIQMNIAQTPILYLLENRIWYLILKGMMLNSLSVLIITLKNILRHREAPVADISYTLKKTKYNFAFRSLPLLIKTIPLA